MCHIGKGILHEQEDQEAKNTMRKDIFALENDEQFIL